MRRTRELLAAAAAIAAIAGCGDGDTADNAVEAREENTVALTGVDYRVVLFRELNPRLEPDDAVWNGPPPAAGHGLYMALLRACATGDEGRATRDIHLEDAFGQRFAPLAGQTDEDFRYDAGTLEPGSCEPAVGSAAARTLDGAALVFEVPFDSIAERPMILELGAPSGEREARIELDL